MQKLGVFWKIQDVCYIMVGTEIFKIEEEITEKMKLKVANPPSKNLNGWEDQSMYIESGEFCPFLEGATSGFIFLVISSSILKISVPIW